MTDALPAHLVDADWLAAHLGAPDLVVVDATTHLPVPADGAYVPASGRADYDRAHIPGAVFADLLTDFADPDAAEPWTVPSRDRFVAAAEALGIGDGARVVVYDQHDGFWATRLWWQLRLEGFDAVAVLDGGLPAWRAFGGQVTDAVSTPRPRTFTGTRRPALLRSTDQIADGLGDADTLLVNVLAPETYRGEVTNYARPGHIPGSINFPVFQIRNAETGTLRPLAELRAAAEEAGLLDPDRTVVTYCGGGIAATGIAHVLALLGRDDVAVYDGSMTAWAGDPDLPLVVGDSPR